MNITVTAKSTRTGVSLTAKGKGKQRTVPGNVDLSAHGNFRAAAAEVARAHGRDLFPMTEVIDVSQGRATYTLN